MAPDANRAPLTSPAMMMTYFRKRWPRGVTTPASPRQYHQQPRDRFFQAALDLVTAGAEDVLTLGAGIVDAVLRQHPLQQHLGHDAPSGVGVAHHQDGFHGSSYRDFQNRRPPPRSRHSSAGRSSIFWPNSMLGGCLRLPPRVSGKIFVSSSGSQRRPCLMCRTAWGWAI